MKITILGPSPIGLALANLLRQNSNNEISHLLKTTSREEELFVPVLNGNKHKDGSLNLKFLTISEQNILNKSEVILTAIPTTTLPLLIRDLKNCISKDCLLVNISIGLMPNGQTIVEYLKEQLNHSNTISLKGAAFGTEMMRQSPTLLTLGFQHPHQLDTLLNIIDNTHIYLDYTNDIVGVELLGALKDIYAIAIGNIDAQLNSVNTRFALLTKVIEEVKIIIRAMGGSEDSLFLSCGIGEVSMTGLNDLSQYRTLGLLIGKGFFNESLSGNPVVQEAKHSINIINQKLPKLFKEKLVLFNYVNELLNQPHARNIEIDFQKIFKRNYKTILTYGSFDLLHYGHLELLRRIKNLGDRIIIGLSTDKFNEVKNKACIMTYEKRKQLLEGLNYVDLVFPEDNWEQKINDVKHYDVDLFVMGDDWEGKFDFLKEYCEVLYLPRTKGISTTKIKTMLHTE